MHKTGLSVCPDCRKIRKPNNNNHSGASHNNNNNNHVSNNNRLLVNGVARGVRDRDRGKQSRHPREVSLPSSNDSGIDGSDGQCHCCQSHNSSSESGRYFKKYFQITNQKKSKFSVSVNCIPNFTFVLQRPLRGQFDAAHECTRHVEKLPSKEER